MFVVEASDAVHTETETAKTWSETKLEKQVAAASKREVKVMLPATSMLSTTCTDSPCLYYERLTLVVLPLCVGGPDQSEARAS